MLADLTMVKVNRDRVAAFEWKRMCGKLSFQRQ